MFYAYLPESNIFVFTSEEHTRHIREAQANPMASGSIVLETRTVGRLQGLQFSGIVRTPLPQEQRTARNAYLKRFPYAAVAELTLWIFAPIEMKFTDNTLGFGKKLHWKESVPVKND